MARPLVSLCMIVRDEEAFLTECLRRAAPAADEIVIVDTGSRDRTVEIARDAGARVLHFEWQDDFSAPRNFGLEHARGQWVLVLDADEHLDPGAPEEIRAAARDRRLGACYLTFQNLHDGGRAIRNLMARMFRNAPEIRYQNLIHEQVAPAITRYCRAHDLKIGVIRSPVVHHGYTSAVAHGRAKRERNLRLFQKQFERHPDDPYSWYRYGDWLRSLREAGVEAPDPFPALERAHALLAALPAAEVREKVYAPEVAGLLALEHHRRGERERALEVARQGLAHAEPTPNLLYISAGLALDAGRAGDALELYRSCRALGQDPRVIPGQPGVTGHLAAAGAARALAALGRLDEAAATLEGVVAAEPGYREGRAALAEVLLRLDRAREALAHLLALLQQEPHAPAHWARAGECLLRLGRPREAAAWLRKAQEAAPRDDGVRVLRARAAAALGAPDEALAILGEVPATPVLAGAIAVLRALAGDEVAPDPDEVARWSGPLRAAGRADWAERIVTRSGSRGPAAARP
jgi:tetratricopeptide (TPR) repeat protein